MVISFNMKSVAEIVVNGCYQVLLVLLTTSKPELCYNGNCRLHFNRISTALWVGKKCLAGQILVRDHMLDTPGLVKCGRFGLLGGFLPAGRKWG